MRILVVDNEKDLCDSITELLKHEGYDEVKEAYSFDNALKVLKDEYEYDVIISDFSMGKFSGLDLLKTVQNEVGSMPTFILMSGDIDRREIVQNRDQFDLILPKPLNISLLIEKINSL